MKIPPDAAVGHNLGGEHPFYDEELVKVGQTGGIMDYGLCVNDEPLPLHTITHVPNPHA